MLTSNGTPMNDNHPMRLRHPGRLALLMAALLTLGACSLSNTRPDAVEHVVLVWLAQPEETGHRDRIVAATRELAELPGIRGVRFGLPLPSERAVVDSSYDLAIVYTFEDADALAAYLASPQHLKATEETLRPLVERIRVYDYTLAGN